LATRFGERTVLDYTNPYERGVASPPLVGVRLDMNLPDVAFLDLTVVAALTAIVNYWFDTV
jgi:hypothetical protein